VHCVLENHLRPHREAVRRRPEGATMLTTEVRNPDTTPRTGLAARTTGSHKVKGQVSD